MFQNHDSDKTLLQQGSKPLFFVLRSVSSLICPLLSCWESVALAKPTRSSFCMASSVSNQLCAWTFVDRPLLMQGACRFSAVPWSLFNLVCARTSFAQDVSKARHKQVVPCALKCVQTCMRVNMSVTGYCYSKAQEVLLHGFKSIQCCCCVEYTCYPVCSC